MNDTDTTNRKLAQAPGAIPMPGPIGAEIIGIDAAGGISDAEGEFIRRALDEYGVVVLRDQHLTPQDQVGFAAALGKLRVSFFKELAVAGAQELTVVSNIVEHGKPIGLMDAGALWHTDGSYLPRPDMYTVLYGLEIPERDGQPLGNTLFTSTVAAYEDLSDAEKRALQGRQAVHSLGYNMDKKQAGNFRASPRNAAKSADIQDVRHPVVRTHPRTGKRCLYVTEGHTREIVDMPAEESAATLQRLCRHITQEQYRYSHSWRRGDLLVWDNCATQHLAVTDYGDIPRRLHRAGIAGEIPV
ncbi:TauD/TfdA family dioxygenase [Candidimonas humi]|jgi:taurine dioxygenase|uniref:TauD/TfdA dioxygenase family protein n=1 Tax=Candidimonas humi TaxID=683355 RepID=A0ABV8P540_9BURK|nr:TauD/TfdA family dioxygenase [Candidimonas humi]MBV6307233.1 TauD/TfdA family dioxygenase [Candidimonas humi]